MNNGTNLQLVFPELKFRGGLNDCSLFPTTLDSSFHFEFTTSLPNFTNITWCKFNFTSQEAVMRPDKSSKYKIDTFPDDIFRVI